MLLICLMAGTVPAAPKVSEVEYEGKGKVEVSFKKKVQYKNLKLTVKGKGGKKVSARITGKDHDDVDFKIIGYQYGQTYTWTLKGIREKGKGSWTSVKGKIHIPEAPKGIPVKKASYDISDQELDIDFDVPVEWDSVQAAITDGSTDYVRSLSKTGRREIELKVRKMIPGKKYTCRIKGIRKKGASLFSSIVFTIRPEAD